MDRRRLLYGFTEVPDWTRIDFCDEPPKHKTCLMCGVVASQMTWTRCWHAFCPLCVDDLTTEDARNVRCPVDGGVTPLEMVHTEVTDAEFLQSTTALCANHQEGCEYAGPVTDLPQHFKTCGFHRVQCQMCKKSILRQEVKQHAAEECNGLRGERGGTQAVISTRHGDQQTDLLQTDITSIEVLFSKVQRLQQSHDEERKAAVERLDSLAADVQANRNVLTSLQTTANIRLADLESDVDSIQEGYSRRIRSLEETLQVTKYTWRVKNFKDPKKPWLERKTSIFWSEDFYVGLHGYCVQLQCYIHECKDDGRCYLAVFMAIKQGIFDAMLVWPYRRRSVFVLEDQATGKNNKQHTINPDRIKPEFQRCFQRPKERGANAGYGNPRFMAIEDLENLEKGYVKDNSIVISFTSFQT